MRKLTFVFQKFFKLLLIFLFVFVWVRFFARKLILSIFISAIITAIIDFLTDFIIKKKSNRISQTLKEKEEAEDMFTSLATQKNNIDFFTSIVKNITDKNKEFICYNSEGKKTILYPFLSFNTLCINDIAQIIKKTKYKKPEKIVIISGEIESRCNTFIKIFDCEIILLDKYQTYEQLYKKTNTYPKITIKTNQSKKLTIKELIFYSFNKARCKGYFISAFALIFCSLFVRRTLYYTIISSVLLIFAIISYTNPFSKKVTTTNLL